MSENSRHIHRANTRGQANFGWLQSHHSFSFANYYNPERMQFGKLRVLNDDVVAGGAGFETHPHRDMEIVSIPLAGGLEHKDSMGSGGVIRPGEVQIMSAGTGVLHSEFNASPSDPVNFLQIWILPELMRIQPRYEQRHFDLDAHANEFVTVVAGDRERPLADEADAAESVETAAAPGETPLPLWINQSRTRFSLGRFRDGAVSEYRSLHANNGLYLFVIDGSVRVEWSANPDQGLDAGHAVLGPRDALALPAAQIDRLAAQAGDAADTRLLLMDVPIA